MRQILFFSEIGKKDVSKVGGKNASLGEMYSQLKKKRIRVPEGFALTSKAYDTFIKKNNLDSKIRESLKDLDIENIRNLRERGKKVRNLILNAKIPAELRKEIRKSYRELEKKYGKNLEVAVRSSATAEDLPSIDENSNVLVKINGEPIYDTIKNVYDIYGNETNCSIEIPAMENNEVKWARTKQIYKHPAKNKKLYKITTETGREITITGDHSLIILDKDTLKPRISHIKDLKKHEFVPVIKRMDMLHLNRKEINVLDYVKGESVICENGFIYIKNNSNNWKIQNPLSTKLKITQDLAYFLGLYCAEGSIYKDNCITITNSNQKVRDRIKKFLKEISLYKSQTINKSSIRVYCKALVILLHELTGKPLQIKQKGKYCKIKKVPNFIFGCNKETIGAFLAGCFDGDGYIGKEIEYCSTSQKLIGGIVKLLEMLDIEVCIRNKANAYNIKIPASQANKFKSLVNLEDRNKLNKLNKLIASYNKKENHPRFLNSAIPISEELSRRIKLDFNNKLEKTRVEIVICPLCNNKIKKSGYYRNKRRFYCKNCKRAFYEENIKKELVKKYVYYDERGRFKKGVIPWNKALIKKRRLSKNKFKQLMKTYNLEEYSKFFDGNVLWDKIKKVEGMNYDGYVYDFVVPRLENFAAGVGGIITHNTASFAGQQETYLNVKGEKELMEAIVKCYSSLFTDRAISYREENGFDQFSVKLSIGVQKMVRSDRGCAGVIFSIEPNSGFEKIVAIEGSYGLGEVVVKGTVKPDSFYVFKPTLRTIKRELGEKNVKLVFGKKGTKKERVSKKDREKYILGEKEIEELAKYAILIEKHYGKAMDIEWAKDGKDKKLYIVQARPETVHSRKRVVEKYRLVEEGEKIGEGIAIGRRISTGKVHVIKDVNKIEKFKKGEILVTEQTNPDWEPIMKIAKGIITERGGSTSHAAIISRELDVPCIVGAKDVTKKLKNKQEVTLDCSSSRGKVWRGKLKFETKRMDVKKIPKTKTKVMLILGTPEQAFDLSHLKADGIGLARIEHIIGSIIRYHPLYAIEKKKENFYVQKLAEGIAAIASSVYPNQVIVRFSDFKTNEFRNLIGGKKYEPEENNPMLGWRGAARYISKEFKPAFKLELKAIKKVRNEMGLKNVDVMVPFCRTIKEGKEVLKLIKESGLRRKLKVYVMAEIPSNIILAEEFAKLFDGFSIGSNDLTQLALGMGRDNPRLDFDERDEAVKKLIGELIKKAHQHRKPVGICGQAPSKYPDYAEFLIKNRIDSISVNPDVFLETKLRVGKIEGK